MLAPVTVELGQEGATGGGQLRFCWPLDEEVMDPEGFAGVYAKSKRKDGRQDRAAEVISSAIREQVRSDHRMVQIRIHLWNLLSLRRRRGICLQSA